MVEKATLGEGSAPDPSLLVPHPNGACDLHTLIAALDDCWSVVKHAESYER